MSTGTGLSRSDLAAAVATSRELGTDYDDAVAEALAGRLEQVIDERVAARVAESQPSKKNRKAKIDKHQAGMRLSLAIVSLVVAVPMTIVPVTLAADQAAVTVAAVWLGIIILNVMFIVSTRSKSS